MTTVRLSKKKIIVLASENSAKKRALKNILKLFFADPVKVISLSSISGVSDIPLSTKEILRGAQNRIDHVRKNISDADYYIGAEGGLDNVDADRWVLEGWVILENAQGKKFLGSSAGVEIPKKFAKAIIDGGKISGVISDDFFSKKMLRQRSRIGTNGLLTNGTYTRVQEFEDALKIAFAEMFSGLYL